MELLGTVLQPYNRSRAQPYITLTFAESSDGKIAGVGGKQILLSGKESMIMTHWMRTMHDAILIGIGTALNDDPQLNSIVISLFQVYYVFHPHPFAARHLPPRVNPYHLPRPLVLDTHLRLRSTCKLLLNYQEGRGRRPWIICADSAQNSEWTERFTALQTAGARIIPIPTSPEDGLLSIPSLIEKLKELGIRSLMVEGGARVIQSFLAKTTVDTIIITTAPKVVGADGIGHGMKLDSEREITGFKLVTSEKFGDDDVVAWSRLPNA